MSASNPRITSTDHGGKLVLAAALCLAYTLILVAIRLHSRWPWKTSLKREDFVLLAATVSAIAYTICICTGIHHGFGQHADRISSDNFADIKNSFLVSFLFFYLTKGLAIISYGLFLQSLSEDPTYRRAMLAVIGVSAVWSVAGMISSIVSCARTIPPSRPTWMAFGAIEAIILIAFFALSNRTIWTVQMKWWRKMNATLWFSVVLVLVALIIGRLAYTPTDLFRSDFTWNTIYYFIILTAEVNLTVINAAYPNLLAFISKTSTGFMNTAPTGGTYGSQNMGSQTGTYRQHIKLRNDPQSRISVLAQREQDGHSMKSFNSQQIMISKSVTVKDDHDILDAGESSTSASR